MAYEDLKELVNNADLLINKFDDNKKNIDINKSDIAYYTKCVINTNQFIYEVMIDKVAQIETIISEILYNHFKKFFKINLVLEKNTITVEFLTTRNNSIKKFKPVLKEGGGGVADLISFILRTIFLNYSNNIKVIFLDEPFKNISASKKEIAITLIKELSASLNMQFIMILHDVKYIACADKIHEIVGQDSPFIANEEI